MDEKCSGEPQGHLSPETERTGHGKNLKEGGKDEGGGLRGTKEVGLRKRVHLSTSSNSTIATWENASKMDYGFLKITPQGEGLNKRCFTVSVFYWLF